MILITESWLTDGLSNFELFDERYSVYRKDRDNEKLRGEGVIIAAKKKITIERVDFICDCDIECLMTKAKYKGSSFIVYCVYIPPNTGIAHFNLFLEAVESSCGDSDVLIVGDFNVPNYVIGKCDKSIMIENFLIFCNLEQHNAVVNCMGRKLDLVFSNLNIVSCLPCDSPLVPEDTYHPALVLTMQVRDRSGRKNKNKGINASYKYDYAKGNFILLYNLIKSVQWGELSAVRDVNVAFQKFYKLMYKCINEAIPKKKIVQNYKHKYPRFYSVELKANIKEKTNCIKKSKGLGLT